MYRTRPANRTRSCSPPYTAAYTYCYTLIIVHQSTYYFRFKFLTFYSFFVFNCDTYNTILLCSSHLYIIYYIIVSTVFCFFFFIVAFLTKSLDSTCTWSTPPLPQIVLSRITPGQLRKIFLM